MIESEYQRSRELSARRMVDFVSCLQNYHKQLLREIELHEKQFNDVHNLGAVLIKQGHPAGEVIEVYLRTMQNQWDWILNLNKCLEGHLRDACNAKAFVEESEQVEQQMQKQLASFPSVVFGIPPPDPRLASFLSRLHNQFEKLRKLWDRTHHLVRYNMVLNTMRTVRTWDLDTFLCILSDQRDEIIKTLNEDVNKLLSEMDPNDPLAKRLKDELRMTNEHFYDLLARAQKEPEPDYSNQFDAACAELLCKFKEGGKQLNHRVQKRMATNVRRFSFRRSCAILLFLFLLVCKFPHTNSREITIEYGMCWIERNTETRTGMCPSTPTPTTSDSTTPTTSDSTTTTTTMTTTPPTTTQKKQPDDGKKPKKSDFWTVNKIISIGVPLCILVLLALSAPWWLPKLKKWGSKRQKNVKLPRSRDPGEEERGKPINEKNASKKKLKDFKKSITDMGQKIEKKPLSLDEKSVLDEQTQLGNLREEFDQKRKNFEELTKSLTSQDEKGRINEMNKHWKNLNQQIVDRGNLLSSRLKEIRQLEQMLDEFVAFVNEKQEELGMMRDCSDKGQLSRLSTLKNDLDKNERKLNNQLNAISSKKGNNSKSIIINITSSSSSSNKKRNKKKKKEQKEPIDGGTVRPSLSPAIDSKLNTLCPNLKLLWTDLVQYERKLNEEELSELTKNLGTALQDIEERMRLLAHSEDDEKLMVDEQRNLGLLQDEFMAKLPEFEKVMELAKKLQHKHEPAMKLRERWEQLNQLIKGREKKLRAKLDEIYNKSTYMSTLK